MADNALTIEQLAAQTGMTVRNIRSHQARGLLAPPEVRLRVGYYGPDHAERLELIRDLQDEGFNLNGIKRLLDDSDGDGRAPAAVQARDRHAVRRAARAAHRRGARGEVPRRAAGRAPRTPSAPACSSTGGDGTYGVPSPSLLAVAEEVARRGISVDGALAVFAELEKHCDAVAHAFVRLFVREVWRPFLKDDMPPDRWREIDESLERLRPLASDALLAIFQRRMRTQIEAAFGDAAPRIPEASE